MGREKIAKMRNIQESPENLNAGIGVTGRSKKKMKKIISKILVGAMVIAAIPLQPISAAEAKEDSSGYESMAAPENSIESNGAEIELFAESRYGEEVKNAGPRKRFLSFSSSFRRADCTRAVSMRPRNRDTASYDRAPFSRNADRAVYDGSPAVPLSCFSCYMLS